MTRTEPPPPVRRAVAPARVLLGLLVLVASGAAALLACRLLPDSGAGTALAFAAGVVLAPILASPVEWTVHRYLYHRAAPGFHWLYDIHQRVHHHVFYPTWRYVTTGPPRRLPIFVARPDDVATTALGNAAIHFAHWLFYMLVGTPFLVVPAWLLTGSLPLIAGLLASSAVAADLMVTVHDAIHRPGIHPWMEKTFWFRFLDRHHYIHHVDTEANVNFLLPLADLLFGTLRLTLTESELARHGSWETAKGHIIGTSEQPAHAALRAQPAVRAS